MRTDTYTHTHTGTHTHTHTHTHRQTRYSTHEYGTHIFLWCQYQWYTEYSQKICSCCHIPSKEKIFPVRNDVTSLTQDNGVDPYSTGGGFLVTNKEWSAFPSAITQSRSTVSFMVINCTKLSPLALIRGKIPGTRWIVGQIDAVRNSKISSPCQ